LNIDIKKSEFDRRRAEKEAGVEEAKPARLMM
jgi:hypothetical protein